MSIQHCDDCGLYLDPAEYKTCRECMKETAKRQKIAKRNKDNECILENETEDLNK